VAVLRRHDLVVGRPQHEGVAAEPGQRLGVPDQAGRVEPAAAVGAQIAPDAGLTEDGLGPAPDQVVGQRAASHLAEQRRQPAQPADPQLAGRQPQATGQQCGQLRHLPRQARWEVVERLTGQDHLARHPPVPAGGGEEQPTAPVRVHERHLREVEGVEQVGEQRDLAAQGQVGAGVHRAPVRPQGQDGAEVAEARRQQRQHAVPERVVHEQPVQQHDRRPRPGLVVLDLPGRHGHGLHGASR